MIDFAGLCKGSTNFYHNLQILYSANTVKKPETIQPNYLSQLQFCIRMHKIEADSNCLSFLNFV